MLDQELRMMAGNEMEAVKRMSKSCERKCLKSIRASA